MKLRPVGLLALGLLLLSGCWADGVFPCETDAHCPTGLVCDEGLTHEVTGSYVCVEVAASDDDDTTPVDDDDTTPVDDDDTTPVDDDDTTPVDDDDSTPVDGFVSVPAGTFEMGCTVGQSSCDSDEPAHPVTLTHDFEFGRYEVTQGEWQGLMGNNPSSSASCGADCPVETVNWWEALSFANALSSAEGLAECYTLSACTGTAGMDLGCSGVTITAPTGSVYDCEGYRLPTEAEWEYAARGGEDLLYSGSDTLDAVGWYIGNSGTTTHPVGQLQANAFGLSDMSGNVVEWTQDWYDGSYYSSSPDTAPPGPSTGSTRVVRGGSWIDSASYSRAAFRGNSTPGSRARGIGFRLSRSIP